jgi:hypothetical protein
MEDSPPDIPTLWDDETDDRLKYTHSIAEVTVEVKRISNGVKQVNEGEKHSRGEDTEWDVVVSHGKPELEHGERKSTESEAEELAVEFMNEFGENYEGDAQEAYIKTLESR